MRAILICTGKGIHCKIYYQIPLCLRSRLSTAGLKLEPKTKNNFQNVRQSNTKMRIASISEFHEETDEDSNADEGLGCEIIDTKDIETKNYETEQFTTKVNRVLKVDKE